MSLFCSHCVSEETQAQSGRSAQAFYPVSSKTMADLPKPSGAHCNFPWPVLGAGWRAVVSEEWVLMGASQRLDEGCCGLKSPSHTFDCWCYSARQEGLWCLEWLFESVVSAWEGNQRDRHYFLIGPIRTQVKPLSPEMIR